MSYSFSKSSYKNMSGAHPDLIAIFNEAIKCSPIDFGVPSTGGVRTASEQNELFLDGKSKLDGYEKKSNHQVKDDGYGYALDFYAYVNGKATWRETHLAMIAGVLMSTANRLRKQGKISHYIYWGGQFGSAEFSGWDFPHVELRK